MLRDGMMRQAKPLDHLPASPPAFWQESRAAAVDSNSHTHTDAVSGARQRRQTQVPSSPADACSKGWRREDGKGFSDYQSFPARSLRQRRLQTATQTHTHTHTIACHNCLSLLFDSRSEGSVITVVVSGEGKMRVEVERRQNVSIVSSLIFIIRRNASALAVQPTTPPPSVLLSLSF